MQHACPHTSKMKVTVVLNIAQFSADCSTSWFPRSIHPFFQNWLDAYFFFQHILYCFIFSTLKSAYSLKKNPKTPPDSPCLPLFACFFSPSNGYKEFWVWCSQKSWKLWHVSPFKVSKVLPWWDERAPKNGVPFLLLVVGLKCMTISQTTSQWLCQLALLDCVFVVVKCFLSALSNTHSEWPHLGAQFVLWYVKGSLFLDSHSSRKSGLGINERDFQVLIWQVFEDQADC